MRVSKQLMKPFQQTARQAGMSIIEILIVIALIGTVMAIMVTNLTGRQDEAMKQAAELSMGQLESSLQMYKIDNYRYPTTEQGLSALVSKPSGARRWRGPYTEKNKLQDPWGNEFSYESDGKTFKIISPGIDGSVGNEDDVTYPREEESE